MLRSTLFVLFLSTSASAADLDAFRAFGEKPGLVRVVDDFHLNLLADKRTKPFFDKVDPVRLKEKLVEQFCVELGGPCTYTGQTMKRSHKGHEIGAADFYALVEALQLAMDKNGVPTRAQNKLLARLAAMHKDIINK